MKDSIKGILEELLILHPALDVCKDDIIRAWSILMKCFSMGRAVLICGNGGSAADSEHMVGELMKNFRLKRKLPESDRISIYSACPEDAQYFVDRLQGALPAISLVSQTSLTTAVSNDVDAEMIFAQQVYGYRNLSGALIAITTTGNSANVVNACKAAKAFKIPTIALTGQSGGIVRDICDIDIRVPATKVHKVQEFLLPVYHTLCAIVEDAYFGDTAGF